MSPANGSHTMVVNRSARTGWNALWARRRRVAYPSVATVWDVTNRVLAGLLLVPTLPLIALGVMLVCITSPGPGLYRQVRLGLRGRRFTIYKIRTMVADAEARTGPVWSRTRDPRITRFGGLLRALSWDELPQLWNILKGDMVFVGPRPERPEIAESLTHGIAGYYDRLAVKPGLTGLAQINLSADTQLDDVRRKLQLDLEYIGSASLWLDLRLVLATLPRLFGCRGAPLAWALGVGRSVPRVPTPSLVLEPANPHLARLFNNAKDLQVQPLARNSLLISFRCPASPHVSETSDGAGRRDSAKSATFRRRAA